ncbi:MAG: two-component system response regulator [Bacteroidetes bacterium GWF2_38_335]|nr:MAG: two-component system response regulator [Bacteroidetes bacterium GWF2_38_335]OFY78283.1 MAG: two-component system response regulator [Bacteroidetes bacterium RIFOXYA12_FULL_38_20]HBS87522.1 DNA-binding response regulator [Bacteroidales bacterium]
MNEKFRILLAEDDQNLGLLLKEYLVAKNYNTDLFVDGEKAYKAFCNNHYDICIFDVMMPKKDGFSLAKDIRLNNKEIPIIFLTAKSMKQDVFEGFKSGADDYITKPFSMEELLFRIEAILRRTQKDFSKEEKTEFELGIFSFDSHRQTLINNSNKSDVKLTTKESDLLKLLCLNMNEVLERNYALKSIWLDDNYFNARSMDVYITKIRKYLKDEPRIEILNVHGKGYKLVM